MEIKNYAMIFLVLCSLVFGASDIEHGADVYLVNDGAKIIWTNNSQTVSVSANPSASESYELVFPAAKGSVGQPLIIDSIVSNTVTLDFDTASSAAAHDILSATHDDSTTAAVTQGSLVIGNATPKWDELAISSSIGSTLTKVVGTDGTDSGFRTLANFALDIDSMLDHDLIGGTALVGDSTVHDVRYYTETEISSNGATPGTSLVGVPTLDSATYSTLQEFLNTRSAGLVSGGGLTADTAVVDAAAGTGMIKVSDSSVGEIHFFDWDAANDVALTDNALNYVYVNYNVGTEAVTVAATTTLEDINLRTQIPIGVVYRSGDHVEAIDDGVNITDFEGEHWHRLAHRGIERMSGAEISESGERYLTVTAGSYYKITAHINTDAVDTTGAGRFQPVYRDGGGDWTFGAEAQQFSNILYDDGDGTPGNVGVAKYATYYVYQCLEGDIYIQYGQGNLNTLVTAQNEVIPTPPNYLLRWATLRAKIIILNGATNAISVSNYTATGLTSFFAGVHNELSGLQGGTSDEYYHLTSTTHTFIDQDVTSGSDPVFEGTNFTIIPDGALVESYVNHTLADAANDFLVASGADTFVKKTLAETGAILEGDINHDNLVDFEADEHFTQANITTLGTIATGVWQATDVGVAYGGTGFSTLDAFLLVDGSNPMEATLDLNNNDIDKVGDINGIITETAIEAISNLDAYWRFENTLADETGGGHLLVHNGSGSIAYCLRGSTYGIIGDALAKYSCSSDNYKGPDQNNTGEGGISIVFAIQTTDSTAAPIITWGDVTANGERCHIRLNNGVVGAAGAIQCLFGDGNCTSTIAINDGEWHIVQVVFPEESGGTQYGNVVFYLDGVLDTDAVNNTNPTNQLTPDLAGGVDFRLLDNDTGAATALSGCIDEVAIYDGTALTQQNVTDITRDIRDRLVSVDGTLKVGKLDVAEDLIVGGTSDFSDDVTIGTGITLEESTGQVIADSVYVNGGQIELDGATGNVLIEGLMDAEGHLHGAHSLFDAIIVTAAGPTDNVDVSDAGIVRVSTASNNVTIGGFINGVLGQTIDIVIVNPNNDFTLEYNEGVNQSIFLRGSADVTLTTSYGGFRLFCDGSNWFEIGR